MTKETLEGLSLALCVADILGGYVQEGEVSRIISSAPAPATPKAFEDVLQVYARTYWVRQAEEGKSIARRFNDAGKIAFAGVQDCTQGHWRSVAIVSALDIDGRRKDREALTGGVSLARAKMKTLQLKTAGTP